MSYTLDLVPVQRMRSLINRRAMFLPVEGGRIDDGALVDLAVEQVVIAAIVDHVRISALCSDRI